ncbi:MAG: MotA/TolQ/ExbB proton channel family protein [Proteobacteria bacterium]|nr:MotA/TolQ/ExbB proton channel family protein [Pseudomonadota bacterium]
MDIATIAGVLLGFGLIIVSILLSGSLMAFVNIPGLAIVVGGTIAATLIMQRLSVVLGAVKVAINVLKSGTGSSVDLIKEMVQLSDVARKEGLLALEKAKPKNLFLAKGLRLLADGVDLKDIAAILKTELLYIKQRHKRGQKIFKFMTATAPAMGMVGTLIGLVQMLMSLSDPSAIGPAMAVALLTTFYGAVLAFLVFGPIAAKLESRTDEESAQLEMILSGIAGIYNKENPRMIELRLATFLDPKTRNSLGGDKNKGDGKDKKAA